MLSTMHSAKGLEFDVVYVIHAADGNIPSDMATGSRGGSRRSAGCSTSRARAPRTSSTSRSRSGTTRSRTADRTRHGYAQRTRFLAERVHAALRRGPGVARTVARDDGRCAGLPRPCRARHPRPASATAVGVSTRVAGQRRLQALRLDDDLHGLARIRHEPEPLGGPLERQPVRDRGRRRARARSRSGPAPSPGRPARRRTRCAR